MSKYIFRNEKGGFESAYDKNSLMKLCYEEISDLEAKLAESEKERHEEWKTGKEWKWEWQKVNQKLEKADQDKISFAIEQLEELKVKLHIIHTNGYLKAIDEEIDNQIKELKGKVKNE